MNNALLKIKEFIEHQITPKEFEKLIYNSEPLKGLIEEYADYQNYMNGLSAYEYLTTLNFSKIEHIVNAIDILEKILNKNKVSYKSDDYYQKKFNLILGAIPSWVPDHIDLINSLYEQYKPNKTSEFKKVILDTFVYYNKKPKWIQSPDWIINENNQPMIFIEQIDVSKIYHDKTFLYVFLDKEKDMYHFLRQSA